MIYYIKTPLFCKKVIFMNKKYLISNYHLRKNSFKNIQSAGPNLYFYNPHIGYIKKGYAKFLYKGQTLFAYAGDLVYISYGTTYHSVWYGEPDIEWYSIDFNFKSEYNFNEYQFQILKNYPAELFEKMYETYQESCFLCVSYFYQLLDDIYKKLKISSYTTSYTTIGPAIEYIENNYNQNISIITLAKLCHCSESGFFRLFKKSTGVTPVTYKHNIMIQHALDLLSHTTLSIEEISSEIGFSSSNYFRTVFLKLTGTTPKELRKKH